MFGVYLLFFFLVRVVWEGTVWVVVCVFGVDFEGVEGEEALGGWGYVHQVVVVIVYTVCCHKWPRNKRTRTLSHPSHPTRFLLTAEDLQQFINIETLLQ